MQTSTRLGLLLVRQLTFIYICFVQCSRFAGSIPFILRSHLSYSQIGVFALSGYPYSLKLVWSPIVDSIFFRSIGRRKSWIVPMQLIIGTLMLWIAQNSEELMNSVSVVWMRRFHSLTCSFHISARIAFRPVDSSVYHVGLLCCNTRCVNYP